MSIDVKDIKVVVPARLGSKRIKVKSLRLLNGKPLIEYILATLKQTNYLTNIYLNSDSDVFSVIAKNNGVNFYQRKKELATSESLIDDYIYDFMIKEPSSFLAVVNPTSPFISAKELDRAVEYFFEGNFDTLLSCEKIQTHCFLDGEPINFSINGKHPRSQDIKPVRALNFAITIWKTSSYLTNYEKKEFGVYSGNLGFFDIEGVGTIDIDYEDDFLFAEFVARQLKNDKKYPIEYSSVIKDLIDSNIKTEN